MRCLFMSGGISSDGDENLDCATSVRESYFSGLTWQGGWHMFVPWCLGDVNMGCHVLHSHQEGGMFFILRMGVMFSILTRRGGHVLHSPQGVMFSKL